MSHSKHFLPLNTLLRLRLMIAACVGFFTLNSAPAAESLVAWGNDNSLQAEIPAGLNNVAALAAGTLHSVALRSNGTVVAWGDNFFGQTNVPPNLTNVVAVAAGESYSLALKSNGTVVVWGTQPAAPADLTNAVAIAAGWHHCLAVRQDGTVVSWGNTNPVPTGLKNVIAVAAGDEHSMALMNDGKIVAWGNNSYGQTNVPAGLSNVMAIACGKNHSLALRRDGKLFAWGRNEDGQTTVPPTLTNVVSVTAGAFHTVALKGNGTIAAWGNNVFNQSIVPGWTGFHRVVAGGYHNLGIIGDGNLPFVVLQPRSQTVPVTQDVTFLVAGVGAQPMGFQWRKDTTNIVAATNNFLTLTNIQMSDAGSYFVTLSNSVGVVSSAPAVLTPVILPPVVLVPPQNTNKLCGDTVEFSATIDGTPPFDYQWLFGGSPILDATNASLVLSNITSAQVGGYAVVITNVAGSTTSAVATLTVDVEVPYITSILVADGIQCQPFTYTITAMHGPIRFEATDLPLGLTLDETNGIISGAAIESGTFTPTISAINNCATQSETLTLNFFPGAPVITSLLTVSGVQGQSFRYTITALYDPVRFEAFALPLGLSIDTNSGVISGVPVEGGTFTPTITAVNACVSYSDILTLTFSSGVPGITSPLLVGGEEDQNLTYQITANGSPFGFGAKDLPEGLTVNPITGLVSGQPVFAGEFDSTIFATNIWGPGSATVHFSIVNKPITGLSIANVTCTYSSPYLLDFEFSLRDNDDPTQGNAVVAPPQLLSVVCKEDNQTISPSETAVLITPGTAKQLKVNLVLDFTESIASLVNGDANSDGISDAVDQMVEGAQTFVNQQATATQIGLYEFHREDQNPTNVLGLTTDKALLNQSIAGIWTNYVQWFPAASRCWDALTMAISDLGTSNRDEQHYVIFISDGRDESSLSTLDSVITDATNSGVKIYCIGFGDEIDTNNLIAVTSETHGRYYPATNATDLSAQFAQIGKDLNGQYILRWATLKRSSTAFKPSFSVTYQGFTALSPTNIPPMTVVDNSTSPPTTNTIPAVIIIPDYIPTDHAGPVTQGALRLSADAAVSPTAITLRAAYVPRFIRQLRLHYRANWPCTTTLLSTAPGEILSGWSLSETNDGSGGTWLLLSSPNPQSITNSIQFAALGGLLHFNFQDVLNPSNAFSFIEVDNTIYTNTGGQKFIIENSNAFLTVYADLPFHTPVPWLMAHGILNNFPAAEIADPDGDGIPTWQEYVANTDPNDSNSRFAVSGLTTDIYGRYLITFSSALNRTYRVETSSDLVTWETVEDNIPGTGGDVTILDHRYIPWITQVFYRAVVR